MSGACIPAIARITVKVNGVLDNASLKTCNSEAAVLYLCRRGFHALPVGISTDHLSYKFRW